MVCPKCNSKEIYRFGFIMSANGKKQRYQCQICGHVFINCEKTTKRQQKRLGKKWREIIK